MNYVKNNGKTAVILLIAMLMIFTATLTIAPPASASDGVTVTPWPLGGHDLLRTGYTDAPAPKSNYTSWIFDANTTSRWDGVSVANGTVYIGSDDDNLYALDMVTGAKKWNVTLGGDVRCCPAVSADGTKVYVSSKIGNAFCLNTADGSIVWNVTIGAYNADQFSSPAVSGNNVVIGSMNGSLFCLDAASGAVIWKNQTGISTNNRVGVAIENGKVYATGQDQYVRCYNLTVASPPTAEQVWMSAKMGSYMYGGYIVVSGDYVFAASDSNMKVWKLNKADGTTAATYNLTNRVRGGLAVAYGNVYVVYGYGSTGTYGVAAFDITTNTLKWNFTVTPNPTYGSGDAWYGIPAVAGGMVFVLAPDAYIYALNATTTNSLGEVVWKYQTTAIPSISTTDRSGGAVADGRLFIGAGPTSSSKVYSFVSSPLGPTAIFTESKTEAMTGETIDFNASGSLPGYNGVEDVPIANYTWDFGDGNITTVTVPTISHAYTPVSTTTYTVTLTVTCEDDPMLISHGLTQDSATAQKHIIAGVGGEITPIDKLLMLMPWIGIATAIAIATATTAIAFKKRRP